jgi:cell division inhibitor SulA
MSAALQQERLEALLQHPALWRGRGVALGAGLSTGHAALDAALPGGGWPRHGLVEVLTPGGGHGELSLWTPLLRQLGQQPGQDRWAAFVTPPFEPFAPAWESQGVRARQLLVLRAAEPLWALEQCLLSGACALGFAWPGAGLGMTVLRRLALAAEQGSALAVLVRPLRAAAEHSAAVLRLALTRTGDCLQVRLLKGRGVAPAVVELALP